MLSTIALKRHLEERLSFPSVYRDLSHIFRHFDITFLMILQLLERGDADYKRLVDRISKLEGDMRVIDRKTRGLFPIKEKGES